MDPWGTIAAGIGLNTGGAALKSAAVVEYEDDSEDIRLMASLVSMLSMIGMAVFAIPLTMLGLHPAVVLLAIAALLAGLGHEVFSTGWNVAMMENIPVDRLSRVSSYDILGSFVVMPIGTLIYGWLITHADVSTVLISSGILYAVIALATLVVPSVWRMGRVAVPEKQLADS